MKFISIPE